MVSFLNELEIRKSCSKTSVSFFNKVSSEMQKLSSEVVSFFNELEIRKLCSKTYVSFFNEVALETQKISSEVFLIMDSKRKMLWKDTMSRDKTWSWLTRGLHWKEETHSRRS